MQKISCAAATALFLWFLSEPVVEKLDPIDAGSASAWALDAMKWASAQGLITGRTATTLAPAGTATRAEVAAILMRFYEHVVK